MVIARMFLVPNVLNPVHGSSWGAPPGCDRNVGQGMKPTPMQKNSCDIFTELGFPPAKARNLWLRSELMTALRKRMLRLASRTLVAAKSAGFRWKHWSTSHGRRRGCCQEDQAVYPPRTVPPRKHGHPLLLNQAQPVRPRYRPHPGVHLFLVAHQVA